MPKRKQLHSIETTKLGTEKHAPPSFGPYPKQESLAKTRALEKDSSLQTSRRSRAELQRALIPLLVMKPLPRNASEDVVKTRKLLNDLIAWAPASLLETMLGVVLSDWETSPPSPTVMLRTAEKWESERTRGKIQKRSEWPYRETDVKPRVKRGPDT